MKRMVVCVGVAAVVAAAAALGASYEYDALGRVISVEYDDGATAEYSYDAAGNRTNVTAINSDGDTPIPDGAVVVVPLNGFTVIRLD